MIKNWYEIFLAGIFIVIVIRTVLILTGKSDIEDKVSKVKNLAIGMLLVTLSWALIGIVFNQKIGDFGWFSGGGQNEKGIIEVEEKDINENVTNDTTIQLKIKIGDEEE